MRRKGKLRQEPIVSRKQRIEKVRPRVQKDPKGLNPNNLEALYKVIMIGDPDVGKTSLLLRYADNIFSAAPITTLGLDFKLKPLKVDSHFVKLQIWDTAGQERFKSITQTYLRNANCCIAVYDVTNKDSFLSLGP